MSGSLSPVLERKIKRRSSKRTSQQLNDTLSDSTIEIENCLQAAKFLTTQFTQSTESNSIENDCLIGEQIAAFDSKANKKFKTDQGSARDIFSHSKENNPLTEVQNINSSSGNTTLNVGTSFKTASNKNIQISELNLKKAAQTYDELENEENVEIKILKDTKTSLNDKEIVENQHDWCNNTFIDSLNSIENLSEISSGNSSANESKIVDLVSTIMQGEKYMFNSTPKQNNKTNTIKKKPLRMAHFQPISISEDALKRAADLFKDIEEEFDKTLIYSQSNAMKSSCIKEESTLTDFDDITDTQMNQAADQAIAIDSFGDIFKEWNEHFQDPNYPKDVYEEIGFSTNDLNVAKKSVQLLKMEINKLKYSLKIINSIEDNQTKFLNSNKSIIECPSGFKTAANNAVSISKEALRKANKIFADIDNEHHTNNKSKTHHSSDKNPPVNEVISNFNINKKNNVVHVTGFQTASNKPMQVSNSVLKKVNKLFEAIENDCNTDLVEERPISSVQESFGFKTASNKKVNVSKTAIEKIKNLFDGIDDFEMENNMPQTRSNNNLSQANKNLNIPQSFNKVTSNFNTTKKKDVHATGFQTASNKPMQVSNSALKKVNKLFEAIETDYNTDLINEKPVSKVQKSSESSGFKTASNKKVNVSKRSLEKIKNLFDGIDDFETEIKMPQTNSNNNLPMTIKNFKVPHNIIESNPKQNSNIVSKIVSNFEQKSTKLLNKPNKLSEIFNDQLELEPEKIKLLNETSKPSLYKTENMLLIKPDSDTISPLENDINEYTSQNHDNDLIYINTNQLKEIKKEGTLLAEEEGNFLMPKNEENRQDSLELSYQEEDELNETLVEDIDIFSDRDSSPGCFDTNIELNLDNCKNSESNQSQPLICFEKSVPGNISIWKNNIDKACSKFQRQIKVLKQRKTALQKQQRIIKSQKADHIAVREGYWLNYKKTSHKISLEKFYSLANSLTFYDESMFLWKINSINSTEIHFYLPSPPNSAVIKLSEGAVLVPSLSDKAGIVELEMAFQTMPGVEIKRLPNKWFTNHFRWIVWKLSSMDRQFCNHFTEQCLTPKNIILQLKYRYDRDIFGNERSALRKILEKDENVGRRIVLCVAEIEMISSNIYNVELTDGWYSIQSIFDYPLSKYVREGKITVGTKLITQGAELLNLSDACHPLQISQQTSLKLHCNSTRRVKRFIKLGFQRNPGAIQISLNSVITNGGMIGFVLVLPIRVLPLKYLEKYPNGKWVCRCRRAEKRRESQWEMSREKFVDKIHQEIFQELQSEWREQAKSSNSKKESLQELQVLTCPQTLTNLLENSSDPQYIQEKLSRFQLDSIYQYQSKRNSERQTELNNRLRVRLEKDGLIQRSVFEIQQVIILDAVNPSLSTFYVLEIWNPDSNVYDVLKENCTLKIYNITSNSTRDDRILKTTNQTRFCRVKQETYSKKEYKFYFSIQSMQQCNFIPPPHRYCDTVGVIIRLCAESKKQEIWLSDECERLLKIENKFGNETCASFDGFNVGDLVVVLNISFLKSEKMYTICQLTLVSSVTKNPTQPDVLTAFKELQNKLPVNINELIQHCDDKIDHGDCDF